MEPVYFRSRESEMGVIVSYCFGVRPVFLAVSACALISSVFLGVNAHSIG